jgi:hypothetical protein
MKRKTFYLSCITVFALFVALLPERIFAQKSTYKPIAIPEAIWLETYPSYSWPPSPYGYSEAGIKFLSGDTIINSKAYLKIYHEQLDIWCTATILNDPYYAGALRDDTLEHKTWFVYPGDDEEVLYFDFNLSKGDTVSGNSIIGDGWFDQLIVNDVDTIITLDGMDRRRWLFDVDPYAEESFVIEGIGNSCGLLFPHLIYSEYWTDLIKFSIDTTILYCSQFQGCDLPTDTCISVGTNNLQQQDVKISVYPNPALSGQPIRISNMPFKNDANVTVEFYNIMGIKIVSYTANDSKDIIIHPPEKTGIYFLLLSNEYFKKAFKLNVK